MIRLTTALLAATALAGAAQAKTLAVAPGPDAQERIQTALLDAKPGDVVALAAGRYELSDGLSLDVDDVTVKGAGPDATVLSFRGQKGAGEGLLVTSDRVTVRDLGVEDTKGDGVKSKGADQISFINLRVEWMGGPNEKNGAYGVYPVSSTNVLIDKVVVKGASDAGIYVGQSKNIVVKRSRAEFNVAGIEIENSMNADVFDNVATHNAGGILVFDLAEPAADGRPLHAAVPQQGGAERHAELRAEGQHRRQRAHRHRRDDHGEQGRPRLRQRDRREPDHRGDAGELHRKVRRQDL